MAMSNKSRVSTRICLSCPSFFCLRRTRADRSRPPFFCALHALTVDNRGGGAGLAPLLRAAESKAHHAYAPTPRANSRRQSSGAPCLAGKILGNIAHWQPVLSRYMTALKVCRMSGLRLRPPRFAAGISGSISAHSASVNRLGSANHRDRTSRGFHSSTSAAFHVQLTSLESRGFIH